MEFAQIYRRFGSEVTVIQQNDRIMPREDSDVSAAIRRFLEDEGIHIRCNVQARSVSEKNGILSLLVTNNEGKQEIFSGTHLLVAAGRVPNSETLNPGISGIEVDEKGFIVVDDFCRSSMEGMET